MTTRDALTRQLGSLGHVDPELIAEITAGGRPPFAEVAGATPHGTAVVRRHRSRLVVALAAVGAVLAVAIPATALEFGMPQTIDQFITGDAPSQAKETIPGLIAAQAREGRTVQTITPELTTSGPEGTVALYELTYTQGLIGLAIVDTSNTPPRIAADTAGPPPLLAPGHMLDARLGTVYLPNRDPYYFAGVTAPQVASVDYVDPLGNTRPISVANGYMLGWLAPQTGGGYGDGELIARDSSGVAIGRLDVCQEPAAGEVSMRQHLAGTSDNVKAACALPFQAGG
jgi:hypothetical protein